MLVIKPSFARDGQASYAASRLRVEQHVTEESSKQNTTHTQRVGRRNRNRSLQVRSSNSHDDWPANLGELLEWYTNEVQDVTRAAQVRLENASQIVADYRRNKIDFDEAGKAAEAHYRKWGDIYPGGIEESVRGRNSEEINKAIDDYRQGRSDELRTR